MQKCPSDGRGKKTRRTLQRKAMKDTAETGQIYIAPVPLGHSLKARSQFATQTPPPKERREDSEKRREEKRRMGFEKQILRAGTGPKPIKGQKVTVHCTGYGSLLPFIP